MTGSEQGVLALYWSARREPLELCAEKAFETLNALSSVGMEKFFALARSRQAALRKTFEPTLERVVDRLARGVNRTDRGKQVIPELGWRLSLWSGDRDGESFDVGLLCGSYSNRVPNHLVLRFPTRGARALSQCLGSAERLYDHLCAVWRPDQAALLLGRIQWKDDVLTPEGTIYRLHQAAAGTGPTR